MLFAVALIHSRYIRLVTEQIAVRFAISRRTMRPRSRRISYGSSDDSRHVRSGPVSPSPRNVRHCRRWAESSTFSIDRGQASIAVLTVVQKIMD
jgi:hypothetical protein